MSKEPTVEFYTEYVTRDTEMVEDRLLKVISEIPASAESLLDIGCARGRNLQFIHQHRPNMTLVGTDVSSTTQADLAKIGFQGVSADSSGKIPFEDASFDAVLCGEVIEHVVDTDKMLEEIWRVLRPGGRLVLTTPNLAYFPNRLFLLLGLQPLFTETSLRQNLGRKFALLGQGGMTQGHLKIFTLPAMLDFLQLMKFEVINVHGYRFFQRGPLALFDRIFAIRPSFAAGFVISAKRSNV